MKKSTKNWLKQKLAWVLIVLMSIESFSAVVSSDDGSAFITKAQFEELKSNFEKQIANYNASLDEKIDGAISNYINGQNVVKKTKMKPLVENYKDIIWKNDIFVKVWQRSWTNYNTYTDTSFGWQLPYFRNNRQVRAGRYNFGALRFDDINMGNMNININGSGVEFKADDNWFPTGEGTSGSLQPRSIGVLCLMCDEYEKGPKMTTGSPLQRDTQMNDSAYVGHFEGNATYDMPINITSANGCGLIEEPRNDGELFAFHLRYRTCNWDGTNVSIASSNTTRFAFTEQYNTYGDILWTGMNVGTSLGTQLWYNGNLGQFKSPITLTNWRTSAQRDADLQNIKYMMLGSPSNTKVNCAIKMKNRKFAPWTTYDYSNSELGSINAVVYAYVGRNAQGYGAAFPSINDAGTTIKTRFYLPLWPKYNLREIYTPQFLFQNNSLRLGDGIPIINQIVNDGLIRIELDYEVLNADLDATVSPSQSIYMSFKKTNFLDTADDYYKDENGNKLHDVLWEPTTSDTKYKISIPIKADESMWFMIGPKDRNATGLYAKIRDLSVIYENEY